MFEAAGYSPLGPIAMNCFAPDEANMHLLEQVAEEAQKEEYLRPLAAGDIRSCFMMTEPAPGAGADPAMLLTTARRDTGGNRGDFVIDGEKWLITGAVGAKFAIVMARNDSDELGPAGATMFLAPMDAPGIHIERVLDTLDGFMAGGHAVIRLDGLRVPETAVLGKVGQGFRYAQARLAPARLTHCMRWLGAARRCHDIATDYARRRHAFGKPLGEHEGVGFMLADNEMDIHTSRLAIWHCAWVLDQGERGRHEFEHGQGHLLGGDLAHRRPLDAGSRRARHHRRHHRRPHLPRGAPVPHLRRPQRSASLVDRPARTAQRRRGVIRRA